jgi:thiol-disulfide isomerase/thioredoxin
MISLNDKIYGLSLLSWVLIIIVLIFFFVQIFSTSTEKFEEVNEDVPVKTSNNNNNTKVYNFNTSWCGWSVKFQPEWDNFTQAVQSDPSLSGVEVIDVKCDNPENEKMCKDFEVNGFPTVIIDHNGQKGVYKGARDAKEMLETIKEL